mgnify:CR=1 FL=1
MSFKRIFSLVATACFICECNTNQDKQSKTQTNTITQSNIEEIQHILTSKLSFVTGLVGSGKTRVIAGIVNSSESRNEETHIMTASLIKPQGSQEYETKIQARSGYKVDAININNITIEQLENTITNAIKNSKKQNIRFIIDESQFITKNQLDCILKTTNNIQKVRITFFGLMMDYLNSPFDFGDISGIYFLENILTKEEIQHIKNVFAHKDHLDRVVKIKEVFSKSKNAVIRDVKCLHCDNSAIISAKLTSSKTKGQVNSEKKQYEPVCLCCYNKCEYERKNN